MRRRRSVNELCYKVGESGQILVLAEDVFRHFHEHRQILPNQLEAGGQLFATFDEATIRISRATGPRRSDKRSIHRFIPNRLAERREIAALFRKGLHYVGDWHTHPQRIAMPSSTDINSITDTFRLSRHGLAGFVMIIVGTRPAPEGLYVAVCDQGNCEAIKASGFNDDDSEFE